MSADDLRAMLTQIIALIILAMPLFLLPALIKVSGGILGRIHDMTRRGVSKYGGDQLDGLGKGFRKGRAKEAWNNSGLANALNYRKSMREFRATKRRGRAPSWLNDTMGGKGYADSARRRAAGYERKEEQDAVNDGRAQISHMKNGELTKIANGSVREFEDKDGEIRQVTKYSRIAAAEQVLETGNFAERSKIYDSVENEAKLGTAEFREQQMLRKTISDGGFKRGDTATVHPGYFGEVLTGNSGGKTGRLNGVAQSIAAGRIKAKGLVHDAAETEDVLTVLKQFQSDAAFKSNPEQYLKERGIELKGDTAEKRAEHLKTIQSNIQAMSGVAYETLHGEETRGDAITPGFKISLDQIATMYPATVPAASGTGGGGVATVNVQPTQTAPVQVQQPAATQPNVTRGLTVNDVAQYSPQQVEMVVRNGGGAANLGQADLNIVHSAMNQSGKDYGDLGRQVQQAVDRASLSYPPTVPPPIAPSQQTSRPDTQGRPIPGNGPDDFNDRMGR